MANILTAIRIICGLLIIAFPAFSGWYYAFYLLGGLTDAIDGTIARKQGKVTEFGAKFDTIADTVFILAVIVKVASEITISLWLLLWIGVIVILKIANIGIGFIKFKKFVTVHSSVNKICGMIVYLSLIFIGVDFAWMYRGLAIALTCIVATAAALVEGYQIIRTDKQTYIQTNKEEQICTLNRLQ